MPRPTRTILGAIAVISLVLWWRSRGTEPAVHRLAAAAERGPDEARGAAPESGPARGGVAARARELPRLGVARAELVTVSGRVVELASGAPVGDVEVIARGARGETSATTAGDGGFALAVPRGAYRLAVRGRDVLSAGLADLERIDTGPELDLAGVPDESLMPAIDAEGDVAGLELVAVRQATIAGTVRDSDGRPVAHAVVRARGGALRPALGTDSAETDARGGYELHVPVGHYHLDAAHPAYAGLAAPAEVDARAGAPAEVPLVLARGCEIRGRVVRADGTPAGDGAIERRIGPGPAAFVATGRSQPDGTFRWTTTDTGDVVLRAWPWMSPHSPERTFTCSNGTRISGVVFRLADDAPALAGAIVDAGGAPVTSPYLDVEALDPGNPSQQERGDASGRWQVFAAPPGRYRITASAPGLGIATAIVTAPRTDVRLALSGTGRIAGAVRGVAAGSFVATFAACDAHDGRPPVPVAHEPRIVAAAGGRYEIDGAPACDLVLIARERAKAVRAHVQVTAGQTAALDLDLGEP